MSPSESISASRADIPAPEAIFPPQHVQTHSSIVDEQEVSASSHSSSKEESEKSDSDQEDQIEDRETD